MSTPSTIPQPINIYARLRALERQAQLFKDLDQKHEEESALRRQLKELDILEKRLTETKAIIRSLSKEVPYLENGVKTFTSHIEDDCNSYSACLLHPILSDLHKKLPIELRDKVYELLLDFADAFAVPNPTIVGREACNEVQQLFIRKVPINFRGLLDGISIDSLLDTRLSSGGIIRDLVRHLRVFVRYEAPTAAATGLPVMAANTAPVRIANNVQENSEDTYADQWQAEQESYVVFGSSLDGLRTIAFAGRKVRVDLCILGPRLTAGKGGLDRVTYNLFLAVSPVFDYVTIAGGEVTVRLERDKIGLGGDVTGVIKSMDSTNNHFTFLDPHEQVPATALEVWKRNRKEHPQCWTSHGQHKEPSWQHYIFGAEIAGCYCLDCSHCACGRWHHGVLSLDDDEVHNAQPHREDMLRRRRRRREVVDREIRLGADPKASGGNKGKRGLV